MGQQEGSHLQAKEGDLMGNQPNQRLDLKLPGSRTVRTGKKKKKIAVTKKFKSPNLEYFVVTAPAN